MIPSQTSNLCEVARHYFHHNQYALATTVLKQVLLAIPTHPVANELMAYIAENQGNKDAALMYLKRSCEDLHCSAEALYYLGNHYLKQNLFESAIHFLIRSIKKNGADFPEALVDLGNALAGMKKNEEAIDCYKKAIVMQPFKPEIFFNMGRVYDELNQYEKAIESYEKAIRLDANYTKALINQGASLREVKRYQEAKKSIEKALRINPKIAEAWVNAGLIHQEIKEFELAKKCYSNALEIDPENAEANYNLGLLYFNIQEFVLAIKQFEKSANKNNHILSSIVHLGKIYYNYKNYKKSFFYFKKAYRIDKHNIDNIINIGLILFAIKRYKLSYKYINYSFEIDNKNLNASYNKAIFLYKKKKYDEALNLIFDRIYNFDLNLTLKSKYYSLIGLIYFERNEFLSSVKEFRKALRIDQDNIEAHYNLALLYLSLQKFSKGWESYQYRWLAVNFDTPPLITKKKYWNGESTNQTIYLWSEQGIGDQILYGSMFTSLRHYENKFIISLDKRLIPLFQRSFTKIKFVDKNFNLATDSYDEHLPIGNLGQFLRPNKYSFQFSAKPYLKIDTTRSCYFRKKISIDNKLICGISWRSKNLNFGIDKSLALEQLVPILKVPNILFIDLQYGDTSEERALLKEKYGLNLYKVDEIDLYEDIDGLAALINCCDMVVTTSNINAHIAGALDKQTYVLLPKGRGRLWYWHFNQHQSVWYKNLFLFAQKESSLWDSVIDCVLRSLLKFIQKNS